MFQRNSALQGCVQPPSAVDTGRICSALGTTGQGHAVRINIPRGRASRARR